MGFRDKEQERQYKVEWYQRKKAGLPTRTRPHLSESERKQRLRERRKRAHQKELKRRRTLIARHIGTHCYFCNSSHDPKQGRRLSCHKKDGSEHPKFNNAKKEDFEREVQSGEYVCLCYRCHKHIHWCMDVLHMTWEEITKKAST